MSTEEPESELRYLVFHPDNPSNTTIKDEDTGEVLYRVRTSHDNHSVTKVTNAGGQIIASWQWREVRSDLLTLGSSAPIPSSAWLRKSMIPFKDTVYLTDFEKRKYKWKGNGAGLSFELFAETDKTKPLAKFQKFSRIIDRSVTPRVETLTPAKLVLDSRGEAIQDLIVISFCMLEKERRISEVATVSRANNAGVPGTA